MELLYYCLTGSVSLLRSDVQFSYIVLYCRCQPNLQKCLTIAFGSKKESRPLENGNKGPWGEIFKSYSYESICSCPPGSVLFPISPGT